MIRKLKSYYAMPSIMRRLLWEAFYYLAWARIKKRIPFAKIAPQLGEYMQETEYKLHAADARTIRRISRALHTMRKYVFWESECLVMAYAAMRMLEKRGIESTLYMGTAKDEHGRLIAHAWLRSGAIYVTGADEMERYAVVSKFAKRIHGTSSSVIQSQQ